MWCNAKPTRGDVAPFSYLIPVGFPVDSVTAHREAVTASMFVACRRNSYTERRDHKKPVGFLGRPSSPNGFGTNCMRAIIHTGSPAGSHHSHPTEHDTRRCASHSHSHGEGHFIHTICQTNDCNGDQCSITHHVKPWLASIPVTWQSAHGTRHERHT